MPKGHGISRRAKRFYGTVVGEQSIKLFRPLKDGKEVIDTPLVNPIFRQHGKGSDVEIVIFTNEDEATSKEMMTHTINEVSYIPPNLNFVLVITHIVDVETIEAFTDALRESLIDYGLVLNVDETNNRLLAWHSKIDEIGKSPGVIIADRGGYEGIYFLWDKIWNNLGKDAPTDGAIIGTIVKETQDLLSDCATIVDLYEEKSKEKIENNDEPIEWLGNYYVPEELRPLVKAIEISLTVGHGYFNFIADGISGNGKTEFASALATYLNMDFVKVNCHAITDPEAWFAERGAEDGDTYIKKTRFACSLDEGNKVILLDEINRIPPDLANPLMPVLDDSRQYEVAGEIHQLGDNIIFMMTGNFGYEYSGTHSIDKALSNRSQARAKFNRLPNNIEREVLSRRYNLPDEVSTEIMMHMDQIRHITDLEKNRVNADLSTRASLNVAFLVKCGLSIYEAFTLAIFNTIPEEESPKDLSDYIEMQLNTVASAAKGQDRLF